MQLTFYQKTIIGLLLPILGACAAGVCSYQLFEQSGFSARVLLCLGFMALLIHRVLILSLRSLEQAQDVILALANGDHTLSLNQQHPLNIHFQRAQKIMQKARFDAEHKQQFLQSILLHIDLAVMVCDSEGKLLESNPALSQLLGMGIDHVHSLGDLGKKILATDTSKQLTTHWVRGDDKDSLMVSISRVTLQGQRVYLVSLQSIKAELQQREQQAYKQLTKVITHEVGNSVTPLSSLADTCLSLLQNDSLLEEETQEDLCLAMNTIRERADHLTHFIGHLKDLNRLPSPQPQCVSMPIFLQKIERLFATTLDKKNIAFTCQANAEVIIMLDEGQIEQVLINLIKNAIEAVDLKGSHTHAAYSKSISVTLDQHNGKQWSIDVQDNGNGILESTAKMMFVPFFTTKQEGSGIGLALSRQIMMNHVGDLVFIPQSQGACFRCLFSL